MIGPRRLALQPREVPLGGVRGMNVHRTLPHRDLPTIGPWCFLDRFGPETVRMRVEPHPHIGLQTVTWPLVGEVHHRDATGGDATVRRGQLNLMTAGRGIVHSEYSVGEGPVPLDALQLWIALPEPACQGPGGFEQHADLPRIDLPGIDDALSEGDPGSAAVTVVIGELAGHRSPATAYSPLVGAEIALPPGTRVSVPLHFGWEHAMTLVEGDAHVAEHPVPAGDTLYLGDSRDAVEVRTDGGALLFLLGGEPFTSDLVMWWNFAARTHDEIVQARTDWETGAARFGHVPGHGDERIPAPPIPPVRLLPRSRKI